MIARSESRPWSPDLRVGAAAALAAAAFIGSWAVLHHWFYQRDQIVDTPVYQKYGDWMADGKVPYRDFGVEYPPGALPAFALPAIGDRGERERFRIVFESLMAFSGAVAAALTALSLRALGAGRARTLAALAFVGAFPLALGSVVLSRYDLLPAALTAGAVAALLWRRERLGSAALGLATAVKVYPAVILPLVLAHVWRRHGPREAGRCAAWFGAAVGVVVVPFVVVSPGGVLDSATRQLSRPLQIESLSSSFLLAAHHLFGLGITMRSGHGSQNLAGTLPDVLAALQSLAAVGVVVALWVAYARGPAEPDRLVRYVAGTVVAFVALGKVLSPQFLVWLIPLVPLVRGRRGLAASGLLLGALVLTQLWFPFRYWDLALAFDETASWLVLARDLVLLALLAVLTLPRLRAAAR
jgi:Glycosyltransferase family 87